MYCGYDSVLLGGTSVNGIKSSTSMPSVVVPNPWNKYPNLFSPEVVKRCQIDGLGCLLRFLYAANVFNSSSYIDPPAIATCCTTSTCAARLYPPVYELSLCAVLWCFMVGFVISLYWLALFDVGIYNA